MSTRRRIAAVLAALLGLPLILILIAIIAVAVFGVTIDASRWREPLEARASAALGRQVTLDGSLTFEIGREAAVHVGGVRVRNPPGFGAQDLATLGEARVRIDLLAALRGRLQVHSFEATAGLIRFERAVDGRANWTAATSTPAAAERSSPSAALTAIELQRVSIRSFAFEYHDERSGAHHHLDLDELNAVGKWSEPLKLKLRGHVARSFPYVIDVEGGSARLLQEGREAWPFTLDFQFLGTGLHASGTLDVGRGAAEFAFGAGTEDLAQVEQFLQTRLPSFGAAAITGKVVASAASVELSDLHGVLGGSELTGALAVSVGSARRRVSGELAIGVLDLRAFLEAAPQRSSTPLTYDDLTRQALPMRGLVPIDADLVLQVGSWLGFAFEVRDVRLALHADERSLSAPISGTIAGVPLVGRIDLDTAAPTPSLALELDAANLPLSGLRQIVPGTDRVDGELGSVALRFGGRGETLGAIVADLELRVKAQAARVRYASATRPRPVELALDAIEVVLPKGKPLHGTMRGALLGESATLAFRAGELQQLLHEPGTPIELKLTAGGATARVEGTIAWAGAPRGSDLAFSLEARRAGDLARWLALDPESNLPLALHGRLHVDGGWHLEKTTLKLGRSELNVDAHHARKDAEGIIAAAVTSRLIDIPELQTLRRRSAAATPHSLAAWLDIPILPQGVDLTAADVAIGLTKVVLTRTELTDVDLRARIRGGQLLPSPCAARFAGVPFDGTAGLDLRGAVPEVSLAISTGDVDVGLLLRTLGVAENLEAHAEALQMKLIGRGSSPRELLQHSSLEMRLQGGELSVRGPVRRAVAEIRLEQTLVAVQPGKPITVRMQGTLDGTPAELTVATGTLADLAQDASRVPLSVEAKAAGARLALEGKVLLPLGRGGELALTLAGEQLDSLSTLARVALPPWRSWSLAGPISMTPSGYEIAKLAVRVGGSRLYGRGRLDLAGERPRLDMQLSGPEVQLDDFPFEERTAAQRPVTAQSLRATVSRTATQTEDLLSSAFLRRLDAYVDVVVEHVRSGDDRLGAGTLRAQLVEGRLDISPSEIQLPGGSARLSMAYDPTGSEIALAARVAIERFDYGILARRLRPRTDISGLFSLKLEVAGKAPTLSTFLAHASGHMDFAVWPQDLRSGIFDRWAVNLFFQLLPFIDPGAGTHVNCVVVRVDLKDGKLTHDTLLIDTGRVRVFGSGGADFSTEQIAFRFRPRAKGPVLFSLQPPIDVTGTMTDRRMGVARGSTPETLARFFTSVFVVPIQMLTQGRLPADGRDVCTDPLRSPGKE